MSKKPMYLKRKASSKLLVLVIVLAVLAVFHLVVLHLLSQNEKEKVVEQELVQEEVIPQSEFKGKVEEIIAPKSQIKAYYMQQKSNLVAVSFIFDEAGYAYAPRGKEGLMQIAATTLKEGAGWWTAKELRNLLGSKGIRIGFVAERDVFSGSMTFPKEQMAEALKFLREIFRNPHFEEKYVDSARDKNIKLLQVEKEDPQTELALAFEEAIYGDFAYARNPLGKVEDLQRINRRDLLKFVRDYLGKNKIYVGISGNVTRQEAEDLIDFLFKSLPDVADKDIGLPNINWQQQKLQIKREQEQDIVMYASKGTCRKCGDFYPLYIANYIFGGAGLSSRANQALREKEGLTYGVYSTLELGDKSDIITAAFSSAKGKTKRAEELFAQEWQKVSESGFSEDELRQAKDYLLASFNLRFISIAGIADMLVYMQKYDLGSDFLQKRNQMVEDVSLQQLNEVARKYFTNKLLQAEIGNF